MKLTLSLLLLTLTLFGANIDNFAKEMQLHRDYKTALTQAKKENKPLMMVLGADYCPWCRKFEHKVLSSKFVKPRLHSDFVTLVVDKKFDVDTFPTKFRTQFTPRVFFINPKDESILLDTVGYVQRKDFSAKMDEAIKLVQGK